MNILKIRSNDANSVVVAEVGGYAVAEFFYQRGRNNLSHFDAWKLALDFIASQKVHVPSKVMTEAQYKEYQAELDRLQREEEEQR